MCYLDSAYGSEFFLWDVRLQARAFPKCRDSLNADAYCAVLLQEAPSFNASLVLPRELFECSHLSARKPT